MKTLLIGLLALASLSSFASELEQCGAEVSSTSPDVKYLIQYNDGSANLLLDRAQAREVYLALDSKEAPVPSADIPGSSFLMIRKIGKQVVCFKTIIEHNNCAEFQCNLSFKNIPKGE